MKKGAALLIVILFIAIFGAVGVTITRTGLLNGIFTNNTIDVIIAEEASQAGLEAGLLYYKDYSSATADLCVDLDEADLTKITKVESCANNMERTKRYAAVSIKPKPGETSLVSITSVGHYGNVIKSHSITQEASAEPSSPPGPCTTVSVYDWDNFSGPYWACLAVGNYNRAQLADAGMPNDKIASIIVSDGYKATVYVNDNWTGDHLEVTTNLKNLDNVSGGGQFRWDDKISSIRVESGHPCNVAVYTASNFGGNGVCLETGSYPNTSTMFNDNEPIIGNDSISSIKVKGGTFKIYADSSYRGKYCDTINLDISNLASFLRSGITWNDKISSMQVN